MKKEDKENIIIAICYIIIILLFFVLIGLGIYAYFRLSWMVGG